MARGLRWGSLHRACMGRYAGPCAKPRNPQHGRYPTMLPREKGKIGRIGGKWEKMGGNGGKWRMGEKILVKWGGGTMGPCARTQTRSHYSGIVTGGKIFFRTLGALDFRASRGAVPRGGGGLSTGAGGPNAVRCPAASARRGADSAVDVPSPPRHCRWVPNGHVGGRCDRPRRMEGSLC